MHNAHESRKLVKPQCVAVRTPGGKRVTTALATEGSSPSSATVRGHSFAAAASPISLPSGVRSLSRSRTSSSPPSRHRKTTTSSPGEWLSRRRNQESRSVSRFSPQRRKMSPAMMPASSAASPSTTDSTRTPPPAAPAGDAVMPTRMVTLSTPPARKLRTKHNASCHVATGAPGRAPPSEGGPHFFLHTPSPSSEAACAIKVRSSSQMASQFLSKRVQIPKAPGSCHGRDPIPRR
mmetsp:Transcript_92311/g.197792  ORF Transcript_92311/g.197792 Transcript_92311/m.197792 type:complete len:235 (-) Transcript_92311:10-714(-)